MSLKRLKSFRFLILNGGVVLLSQTILKENIALSVVFELPPTI